MPHSDASALCDTRPVDAILSAARRRYVRIMYVLAACWGVAQGADIATGAVYFLAALLLASTATLWAITDNRVRGTRLLRIVQLIYFFSWPLAALIYLAITRQWRGVGYWVLHAIGLCTMVYLTFYPTCLLLDWLGWYGTFSGP